MNWIHNAIDVNSMQTLIKLTQDSVGYAVLPEPEVRHLLKSGEMKQLFTDWELPDIRFMRLHRKGS